MPMISMDGVLISPLYVCLKERIGEFGWVVQKNLCIPANIVFATSISEKLDKKT